jgi:hypothetical protein
MFYYFSGTPYKTCMHFRLSSRSLCQNLSQCVMNIYYSFFVFGRSLIQICFGKLVIMTQVVRGSLQFFWADSWVVPRIISNTLFINYPASDIIYSELLTTSLNEQQISKNTSHFHPVQFLST